MTSNRQQSHAVARCRFCVLSSGPSVEFFGTVYVIEDGYPVSPGHHLVIPSRHCSSVFDLTSREMLDTREALIAIRDRLARASWDAFNVGWNSGAAAGQTVGHAHCHIIPRRLGDVPDPTGGIRGVIPSRRRYEEAPK